MHSYARNDLFGNLRGLMPLDTLARLPLVISVIVSGLSVRRAASGNERGGGGRKPSEHHRAI